MEEEDKKEEEEEEKRALEFLAVALPMEKESKILNIKL